MPLISMELSDAEHADLMAVQAKLGAADIGAVLRAAIVAFITPPPVSSPETIAAPPAKA